MSKTIFGRPRPVLARQSSEDNKTRFDRFKSTSSLRSCCCWSGVGVDGELVGWTGVCLWKGDSQKQNWTYFCNCNHHNGAESISSSISLYHYSVLFLIINHFAFIVWFKYKFIRNSWLYFAMFVFYNWSFLHVCSVFCIECVS